jgi:hypothetical protein
MECRKDDRAREVAKEKRRTRFTYIFVIFRAVIFALNFQPTKDR